MGRGQDRQGKAWVWLTYAMSLAVFLIGVWHSDILNPNRRASLARLALAHEKSSVAVRVSCDSAEKYWNLYPDVAKDGFFGRNGKVGCGGAYEHWLRYGRREGRVWVNGGP